MITRCKALRRFFGRGGLGLVFLGVAAFAAPLAAQTQESPDSATFRTGLGYTSLKFVDLSSTSSTHDFAIVDFGANKSFGGFFVGFDTELPFNQGGTPTNNEMVQTEVADLSLGYTFGSGFSVFGGGHYAKYDFWRNGQLFTRQTDKGPFLGLGYAFSLAKTGQLSASIAHGVFNSQIGAGPGTSTGNSFSLTWADDFRRGLNYYVKLRVLDYKFELDSDVVATGGRDAKKTVTTLSIGLLY
jgi:ABC-type antimicrobial peptide transport system permease subunit